MAGYIVAALAAAPGFARAEIAEDPLPSESAAPAEKEAAPATETEPEHAGEHDGAFARAGHTAYVFGGLPTHTIPAPVGSAAIKVTEDQVTVEGKGGAVPLVDINVLPTPEILWAPDGRAFTVTDSAQGVVGWWRTHLFTLDADDKPAPRDLAGLVAPWYKTFAKCKYQENANFFAGAWLKDGQELLLVLAAPDHASCTNRREISGLRVALDRWVVAEAISADDLVKRYGDKLGRSFRTARPAVAAEVKAKAP
jgi:hypothetical protein